jgi:hypothetical protein
LTGEGLRQSIFILGCQREDHAGRLYRGTARERSLWHTNHNLTGVQ